MKYNPKPLVPVNPEGLDDIARSLLEDKTEIPESNISPSTNTSKPENYIILPSKSHGSYSYPDMLVGIHRLSYTPDVERASKTLTLNIQNTATEKDGSDYIGSINHAQALSLNKTLGNITLDIRRFVDFLNLLKSQNVYDGNGTKLSQERTNAVLDEILTVRTPYRAEWLDARFSEQNKQLRINYHKIKPDGNMQETTETLETCLMKDKQIDLDDWLRRATLHGLPPADVKSGTLYYWAPRNGRTAGFGADSGRAYLDWYVDPAYSDARFGVRGAKIKR